VDPLPQRGGTGRSPYPGAGKRTAKAPLEPQRKELQDEGIKKENQTPKTDEEAGGPRGRKRFTGPTTALGQGSEGLPLRVSAA